MFKVIVAKYGKKKEASSTYDTKEDALTAYCDHVEKACELGIGCNIRLIEIDGKEETELRNFWTADKEAGDRWVSFTEDSFASYEDWETLCEEAECMPDEATKIVVHISAIDCEFE